MSPEDRGILFFWTLFVGALCFAMGNYFADRDGPPEQATPEPTGWTSKYVPVDGNDGYITEVRKNGKLVARFFRLAPNLDSPLGTLPLGPEELESVK